jgi:ketosteroid isomerase-like protein
VPGAPLDPAVIAGAAVGALVEHLRARDLEGALAVFAPDAVLFGSEADERARGVEELRSFLASLFELGHTVGWTWDPAEISAARLGDVAWFVAPAVARLVGDDGSERRLPYRLSGVLHRGEDRTWRFALFNGAEPA